MSDATLTSDACLRCKSTQPTAARFCHRCGHDHLDTRTIAPTAAKVGGVERTERRRHYAIRPTERVRAFHPVSSLLPLSSAGGVRAYQVALAVAAALPIAAAALGWVPFALVAAALAVPTVFTIYLYDVNEWDDQPLAVVLAALIASAGLGAALIWAIDRFLLDTTDALGFGDSGLPVRSVLVLGVVAPIVALAVSSVGALWLAAKPRFDDMIDGLTFGVVSGAAYAAGETLMMHRDVIQAGEVTRSNAALWMAIVANAAVVKPIVYGAAVGVAAAAFSGVGPGYEGFGRRFAKGLAIAAAAMVAHGAGVALLGEIDGAAGAALGLAWGVVVALATIFVLRTQLHLGILEAALEAARGKPNRHEVRGDAHCGECEMFLAPLALFCSACGTSVRATSKIRQRYNVRRTASSGASS
jgi:ribosomal protein L40E